MSENSETLIVRAFAAGFRSGVNLSAVAMTVATIALLVLLLIFDLTKGMLTPSASNVIVGAVAALLITGLALFNASEWMLSLILKQITNQSIGQKKS